MDGFSVQVIHLSLVALQNSPALWRSFNGGDDCLLLRRADFAQPRTSPILSGLVESQDEQVRKTSIALVDFAMRGPEQATSVQSVSTSPSSRTRSVAGLPPWMKASARLVGKRRVERSSPVPPALAVPARQQVAGWQNWRRLDAPDWLLASYPQLQQASFTSRTPCSRLALFLTVISWPLVGTTYTGSELGLLSAVTIAMGTVLVLVVTARVEYIRSPELRACHEMQVRLRATQEERDGLQKELDRAHAEYLRILEDEKRNLRGILDAYARTVKSEQARLSAALDQIRKWCDAFRKQILLQ